jgi:hypothetical protein
MAAGTIAQHVMLFDTRVGESEISLYRAHRGAVLALTMFDNFIVSASEDHTLAVWDRRAEKVLNQLNLYENKVSVAGCYKLTYKCESSVWWYWVSGFFPSSSITNRTHFRKWMFLMCFVWLSK